MVLSAALVGSTAGPLAHTVDERWTMAYAAAVGDDAECYFDTTRTGGIVAHPLFAVCPEWPVIVESRRASEAHAATPDEVRRGIHATHDVTVHRLIRPGDRLTTTMTVTGIERRRPGTFSTSRLTTVDESGAPVATTDYGSLYLGVDLDGADSPAPAAPRPTDDGAGPVVAEIAVPVAAGAAHVYTECARIWNPIHTDAAVAADAGLPAIILHGTATLAIGVSGVVAAVAGGDPGAVRRVLARFGAMVLMPSALTVRAFAPRELADGTTVVPFEVGTDNGRPAVERAAVILA